MINFNKKSKLKWKLFLIKFDFNFKFAYITLSTAFHHPIRGMGLQHFFQVALILFNENLVESALY